MESASRADPQLPLSDGSSSSAGDGPLVAASPLARGRAHGRRLYVVRHGRTRHNAAGVLQGPVLDEPLDVVGIAQAEAIAARLAGERVAVVATSPLARARETAERIASATAAPLVVLPGLVEFSWGTYVGRRREGAVDEGMRAVIARWQRGELDARPPEGESAREVVERALPPIERMLAEREGDVAIVGHGRANKMILAELAFGSPARMEEFPQANGSLTILEREGAGWRLVAVNDRSHLKGLAADLSGD